MPRSTVNLMLAVLAAMASVPVYFISGMIFDHSIIRLSPELPWVLLSGVTTSLFIGGCWAVIWRRSIRWSMRRCLLSVGIFAASWLALSGVIYVWWVTRGHGDEDMFLPLGGVAICLAALLLVWRETAEERRARLVAPTVPCPACGYDLSRLKQTNCPECGTAFTIEQLTAGRAGEC